MKLLKILLIYIGMIVMAITSPIWGLFGFEVTIEANRKQHRTCI